MFKACDTLVYNQSDPVYGTRIEKVWKSFWFIRIRFTDETCVRIRFRIESRFELIEFIRIGHRRIEKEWKFVQISVGFIQLGVGFKRIYSLWYRIYCYWNLKRLTDWKGLKNVSGGCRIHSDRLFGLKCEFDLVSDSFALDKRIEMCVRIHSDRKYRLKIVSSDWFSFIWIDGYGLRNIEIGVHARIKKD